MSEELPTPVPVPDDGSGGDVGPLARKLRQLFETVRRPDGKKYTYRQVSEGVEAAGGPPISTGYLSELVNGIKPNPTLDAVRGLAKFFRVPMSYFDEGGDEDAVLEQLQLLQVMRDAGVKNIALRAAGLPAPSLKLLTEMIDRIRAVEGLPVHPETDPGQAP